MPNVPRRTCAAILGLCAVLACDPPTQPPPPPPPSTDTTPASLSASAGGGETVRVETPVATAPAVVVKNASGQIIADVQVNFTVEAGGGSVAGASTTTDASGIARVGGWTLGPAAGENQLRATVASNTDLSTTFAATGRWPHWTVMVYMAADNNLAVQGILDIDEMEAAGQDPEVQVLVQAEFSPTQLTFYGCDASCFNRPNFNTFRYALTGAQPQTEGPDGETLDIGNRDMTQAGELTDFVSWAKQTAPAEHYALVLWNHGGGYAGLLQDETSAGSQLMSIGSLPGALSPVGPIDIIDFDMCLMAGYETLRTIQDVAGYAVFSEEVVPGSGNPYQEWLDGIQDQAAEDPATVAAALVDAFHDAYQGERSSTTRSAYSLTEYAAFETALDALADLLRTDLASFQSAIHGALQGAQKYDYVELTDLITFLDSLRVRIDDPALLAAIDDVRSRGSSGQFRLRNRVRNGTDVGFGGVNDVARSTGLHVVLPRGADDDRFADAGPRSFAAYQSLYPGRPWTLFLEDWISSQTAVANTDQGDSPFQGFLVWDEASVQLNADVDLWILEPNGNLYIPWLGSVTPNGTLTNDSHDDATWFEGYLTNRYIENGRYKFYAHLYQDPEDHRPVYDLQYRFGFTAPLTSLYDPDYPQLSLQTSWLDDPDPTFAEVESDAYTDLRYVAFLDVGTPTLLALSRADPGPPATQWVAPSAVTPEQLETVRRSLTGRRPPGGEQFSPALRLPPGLREVPR